MLRSGIAEVLSEYNDYKKIQEGVMKDSTVFKIVNEDIPKYLHSYIGDEKYLISGSVGVGRWAEVPWVGIFNKEITTTAQKGYYICFLFGNEMNSVYLTIIHSISKEGFNTSWDQGSMHNFVQNKREELLKKIPQISKFTSAGIKIESPKSFGKSSRAIKYSKSTIAYKEYSKLDLPSEDQLLKDLDLFLEIYDQMGKEFTKIKSSEDQAIDFSSIYKYISQKRFYFKENFINNFYLSLLSKPFVILSGISGTGKTKIVELYAEAVGATYENGRFKLIPVRPDWSDSSDLLGYKDLKNDFIQGPLTKMIVQAHKSPDYPHFVVLDEMNLARVEYYLSDFLSVIESRKFNGKTIETAPIVEFDGKSYGIPDNLYIIGTVNMDETTHPFSKKVLDRANTIEFNEVHLTNFSFLENAQEDIEPIEVTNRLFKTKYIQLPDAIEYIELIKEVSKELEQINAILSSIYAQVGYRVRDEIAFYMSYNEEFNLMSRDEAMDFCIIQKILPRISGAGQEVEEVLDRLLNLFTGGSGSLDSNSNLTETAKYPRSATKLQEMKTRYSTQGFVSYWIS